MEKCLRVECDVECASLEDIKLNWRGFPWHSSPTRCLQRRDEPTHPGTSRPSCMARPAAGSKRQWPDHRGHLLASAQCPLQVAEAYSAASEASAATRSRPLHHEASCCRAQKKRRAVPAHVVGCSLGRSESSRCTVLSRRLGANVARRRGHVRLHVLARGASSRSDSDAGPPARLPRPQSHVRHLAMGEALETSRPYHAATLRGRAEKYAYAEGLGVALDFFRRGYPYP